MPQAKAISKIRFILLGDNIPTKYYLLVKKINKNYIFTSIVLWSRQLTIYLLHCKLLYYSSFHNLVFNQCWHNKPMLKDFAQCICLHFVLISFIPLIWNLYVLQRCLYADDWMTPGVVVRKVFPPLLFPKLNVSFVTAVNKIISQ